MVPREWNIPGPGRVCAATGCPLAPGTTYRSVLYEQAGQLIRQDYLPEAFPGLPDNVIAHWQGRVPVAEPARRAMCLNAEQCLKFLVQTSEDSTERTQLLRYVAALFLWRKRRLRLRQVEIDDQGRERLHLADNKSGRVFVVTDPRLTSAQLDCLQDELARLSGGGDDDIQSTATP
ncbi:MAG: hypothetical protein NZU63_14445 [Gemmataceae bacterium]|nr:hypothetical protein [Gemmataceae bacterium]MDW8243229.1 hypothetical protein [Thermogemmata sp.]